MTYLVALKYSREMSENMPFRPPSVPIKEPLKDLYLEWVNDYLSIEKMASDYNLPTSAMHALVEIGREITRQEQSKL